MSLVYLNLINLEFTGAGKFLALSLIPCCSFCASLCRNSVGRIFPAMPSFQVTLFKRSHLCSWTMMTSWATARRKRQQSSSGVRLILSCLMSHTRGSVSSQAFLYRCTRYGGASPILVGADPMGIAYDYKTKRFYVTNGGDDTVSVIDRNTYTKVDIPVGNGPAGIAYD